MSRRTGNKYKNTFPWYYLKCPVVEGTDTEQFPKIEGLNCKGRIT